MPDSQDHIVSAFFKLKLITQSRTICRGMKFAAQYSPLLYLQRCAYTPNPSHTKNINYLVHSWKLFLNFHVACATVSKKTKFKKDKIEGKLPLKVSKYLKPCCICDHISFSLTLKRTEINTWNYVIEHVACGPFFWGGGGYIGQLYLKRQNKTNC